MSELYIFRGQQWLPSCTIILPKQKLQFQLQLMFISSIFNPPIMLLLSLRLNIAQTAQTIPAPHPPYQLLLSSISVGTLTCHLMCCAATR